MNILKISTLFVVGLLFNLQDEKRTFVALPQNEPVLSELVQEKSIDLPEQIKELVEGLGSAGFKERKQSKKQLTQLILSKGPAAYKLLDVDTYRKHKDPEIAENVKDILSSTKDKLVSPINLLAIKKIIRGGLKDSELTKLNSGGSATAELMLKAHLQKKIGVDVLYSLRPANVLPVAFRILSLQKEEYYKALILKTVEATLERAILPVNKNQAVDLSGLEYFEKNSASAQAIIELCSDSSDVLRESALKICAYGQIELPSSLLESLKKDKVKDIALKAESLQYIIQENLKAPSRTEHSKWIKGCLEALNQKEDLLAQMGAYNALSDLIDHKATELQIFLKEAEGRAKDALFHILCKNVEGRLLLLRDYKPYQITHNPGGSLTGLLNLNDFALGRRKVDDLLERMPEAVAPLVRRNLYVLGKSGESWFAGINSSLDLWNAALKLSMNDLTPILKTVIANNKRSERLEPLVNELAAEKGESFLKKPALSWYRLCVEHLNSGPLDIRTGAIRSLLASGKAGAQALYEGFKNDDKSDKEFSLYLKSLLLFHPYSKFIVEDKELKAELEQYGLFYSKHIEVKRIDRSNRNIYGGSKLKIPTALWGFLNNNDCNAINALGHYLADNVKPVFTPLILSWLDYNSRACLFLIETDARDSKDAVLRRFKERRTDWNYCYDHDFFHYIVAFELEGAIPYLEHYAKTNRSWPYRGVKSLGGIEKCRYCWQSDVKRGRVNPLAIPSIQELVETDKSSVKEHGAKILKELEISK